MLTGLYFYWVCWIVWILLVFFQLFRTNQYVIIVWLFLLMITLSMNVNIYNFQISISFLILLIGSSLLYVQLYTSFRTLLITFTIMIGYIALKIWEVIAPIWFFIPSMMMISLFISAMAIVLIKTFEHRLIHILFGVAFGELFHCLILNGYYLNNEIVPMIFFDYLALTILIIIFVHIIKFVTQYKPVS